MDNSISYIFKWTLRKLYVKANFTLMLIDWMLESVWIYFTFWSCSLIWFVFTRKYLSQHIRKKNTCLKNIKSFCYVSLELISSFSIRVKFCLLLFLSEKYVFKFCKNAYYLRPFSFFSYQNFLFSLPNRSTQ